MEKSLEKILTTKTKIRFQDCDPFNHLNNAKYIDYFINAREDQLKEYYDLDVFEILKTDKVCWVIASNQIAYLAPALTMETVHMRSQLIQFSEKSLMVEMTMWDEALTQLKALLWVKFIHINVVNKASIKHSDDLLSLFNAIIIPVKQSVFEERYKFIAKR